MSAPPAACGLCEQAGDDGHLCRGCTKSTRVRLESLPELYGALAGFLRPGSASSTRYGRAQPVDGRLPVSEPAFNLRGPGGIVGVVEDWYGAVRADRGMSSPPHTGAMEQRLAAAVGGLLANLSWIAMSWPEAGTFAREIRGLVGDVLSVVDPRDPGERGTRLGHCPAQFEDGVICGAVLRLMPGERVVTCRWCGMSYPPASWADLKTLIDHDASPEQAQAS